MIRSAVLQGLLLACLGVSGAAAAVNFEEEYDARPWQELELALPAAPNQAELQSFYVSATSTNTFSIDLSSLQVGAYGVVRYVLQVDTPGGARNVTYEGIRCATGERRIYASGRMDGRWSRSRNNAWSLIRDVATKEHLTVLYQEYFCPAGTIVSTPTEAADALRKGVHQQNRHW